MKKYVEKRIPTSNSESTNPETNADTKKKNKEILVRSCSENRIEVQSAIKSAWTVFVKKSENNSNLEINLFNKQEEVTETAS